MSQQVLSKTSSTIAEPKTSMIVADDWRDHHIRNAGSLFGRNRYLPDPRDSAWRAFKKWNSSGNPFFDHHGKSRIASLPDDLLHQRAMVRLPLGMASRSGY